MQVTELDYAPSSDSAGLALAVSIFADRPHFRGQIADDVAGAGFRIAQEGSLASIASGEVRALGEIVLLDCPTVGAETLAALMRLDMRVAQSGAQLVVSTTVDALEDVFACLDQSGPRILVQPTRGERVVALGQLLAEISHMRMREPSDEDTVSLLRLSEQVAEIARKLDALSDEDRSGSGSAFRFESPAPGYSGPDDADGTGRLTRTPKPPLPEPRLVRQIIRQRQLRARFLDGDLFADPAWDILLDLTAARAEHQRVSVTSLCIASGVPPTTALRWISQMTEAGLLQRVEDEADKRRAFIALTDNASEAMARFFAELGKDASRLV
ncbi:winged helix DNA-binding protein [Parerythrobacter jejuensis]|uniref:Winged helix DNA-binding protein n=1 Tax=Parerythrobacter jejuensis TaxID=795812 RepID=A0A845AN37_9SPHN|nr:winged helix DNA-binding protein [Parerythrobacter jejuensis]MXP31690.1 winged helix DNA-binding protein [Parerythrobacter jejuensis]